MKSYLRLLTSFIALSWASTAWADVPIESYFFNPPGGQATSVTGLRIPAVSSGNASSMVWVSPSLFGGGGSGTISGLVAGQVPLASGPTSLGSSFALGSNVQGALSNALNASGGVVGFSGSLGTPTQLNLANATNLPLAGMATGLTGTQCIHSVSGVLAGTGSDCGAGGGSSGLSGMTAGQVPIAATATTVTSSFPINSGVETALGNALNASGGLVGFGGNIGAATGTSLLTSGAIASGGAPLVANFFNAPNNGGYAAEPSAGGTAHALVTITNANRVAIGNSSDPVDVFGTSLNVPGIAGAGTYCVQVSPSNGMLSNTGAACGSGSGAVNSVTGTAGQIVASPTTGAVVLNLAATITQAENFTGGLQSNGIAVLVNGGALGTPSSGSAANLTGLPLAGMATGLTGTQCIHSVSGTLAGTGSDCGAGSGSGTVSSGTGPAIAQYAAGTGTTVGPATVSGDATLAQGGALTLATVNSTVGTYTNATVTLDAKGRVTSASNGTSSGTVSPGSANQLALYALTGSTVSGLATANNGVVYTNGSGVPAVGNTLPSGLTLPSPTLSGTPSIAAATGTSLVTSGSISVGGAALVAGGNFDTPNNAGYAAQSSGGTPHSLLTLSTTNRVSIGNSSDPVDVFGPSFNVPGIAGAGTYCVQVSSSTGTLSNTGTPCGTGAGVGTVSDTFSHSVTAATSLALGPPFQVNNGTGAATATVVTPDRTVTTGTTTIGSGDVAGQVNVATASTGVTNPDVGTSPYTTGSSLLLANLNIPSVTVTNTGNHVNGVCGGATFTLYSGGFCNYTSNGTTIDSFGFPGFGQLLASNNTFTAGNAITPVALTDGATVAVNAALSNYFTLTLTGASHTLSNPTNVLAGQHLVFAIANGGNTGFATGTNFKYPAGTTPTWSTTNGQTDIINCFAFTSGTAVLHCQASLND